jgi:HPt (histidine-containing phosphotransfer) domain-containing protein
VSNATSGASDAAAEAVEDRQVRAALDEAIDSAQDDVRALTQQLVDGDISLARWQQSMAQAVKDAHLNAGALTKGGFDNLSQADFGQIGGRIRDELEYLRGFAQDIENGAQRLDGTALRRSEMYMGKARKTHHKLHRKEMQKIGYNQERNVLGVAEHCEECVALTNRGDADGWVPNGTLTPIGDRICLSNCKCTIEYRTTETTDPSRFPSVRN